MDRQWLLIVAPLMLIVSRGLAAAAEEPDAGNKAPAEFAGKIVCVQMTNERVVLENVKIIVHGTQSFLAGTGIKRNDSPPCMVGGLAYPPQPAFCRSVFPSVPRAMDGRQEHVRHPRTCFAMNGLATR